MQNLPKIETVEQIRKYWSTEPKIFASANPGAPGLAEAYGKERS